MPFFRILRSFAAAQLYDSPPTERGIWLKPTALTSIAGRPCKTQRRRAATVACVRFVLHALVMDRISPLSASENDAETDGYRFCAEPLLSSRAQKEGFKLATRNKSHPATVTGVTFRKRRWKEKIPQKHFPVSKPLLRNLDKAERGMRNRLKGLRC